MSSSKTVATGDETREKDSCKKATRTRGPKKRKSMYQTDDLIREKSPLPDETLSADPNAPITTGSDNSKPTVQCNICKQRMIESKLANHIRRLHVETESPNELNDSTSKTKTPKEFKCEHCGKLYAINYTYQQHLKTHIEGRPKCPECGSTFASAFSLFRHRARNHNLKHNYKTFSCDQCEKSFFSISELKLHQQRHSSLKEFKCDECEKAFSVKGNLRIHMRTHAKEKPYKCDICGNSFSHPYSLVSHRRIHTNNFPFKCPNCDKGKRLKILSIRSGEKTGLISLSPRQSIAPNISYHRI